MLRDYQANAIQLLREKFISGKRRILLISPTGSGKTVIASEMVRLANAKQNKTLFLAHRQELVFQAVKRLADNSISAGIIMGKHEQTISSVQVASVQTLIRREKPEADLIIIDEAHHATAESYQKIIENYPNAAIIGLTATPFRLDGNGLGNLFEDFVRVAKIDELTDQGFLVPVRYFSHNKIDMTGTKKTRGDFDLSGFNTRLLGNPVESYLKTANESQAIAFCVNVEHSKQLAMQFNMAGISSEAIEANTPNEKRLEILNDFFSGKIKVLTNCGILGEGYDCPQTEVVIMARPTLSLSLYLQQIGRAMRPYEGKEAAIVIDHAGNIERHGFISDVKADLATGIKKTQKNKTISLRTCTQCYAVMQSGAKECSFCSFVFPPPEVPKYGQGELKEIGAKPDWKKEWEMELYLKKQIRLCWYNGRKIGRAWVLFLKKFGRWPTMKEIEQASNQ